MFGRKGAALAAAMALGAWMPGAAEAQEQDMVGAAACLARILPEADVWSAEFKDGEWTALGADLEDTVLRADRLSCSTEMMVIEGMSILPRLPVSQLLVGGAGFRADRVTIRTGEQTICGPILSLAGMEIEKGRWFAWGSDAAKGHLELILRVDGEDIFKPTTLRISSDWMSASPVAGRPSPCAFSFRIGMQNVEVSLDSPLSLKAPAGSVQLSFPSSTEDARASIGAPSLMARIEQAQIVDASLQRVFAAGTIQLDAKGAAGKSLAASYLVEQRLMPFLREGRVPGDPRFMADFANALRFTDLQATLQAPEMTFMPGWVLADVFPANFSAVMLETATSSFKAAVRFLDGQATAGMDFDVLGIARSHTEIQASLPTYSREAIESFRTRGKGPGLNALPVIRTLKLRFQDDGLAESFRRLTGHLLSEAVREWSFLPEEARQEMLAWLEGAEREFSTLAVEFPSPGAIGAMASGTVPPDARFSIAPPAR